MVRDNQIGLLQFCSEQRKILILRSIGGIGDIINTRPLFKQIAELSNGSEITYGLPREYISLVIDHPYIDAVLPIDLIDQDEYAWVGDTTNKAGNYEYKHLPNISLHRSEIWARYLGFNLENHDYNITFYNNEKKLQEEFIDDYSNKEIFIGLMTKTSHPSKDWFDHRWIELIDRIKSEYNNIHVFRFGMKKPKMSNVIDVDTRGNLRKWMYLTATMNLIITPATSMFCLANALHIPTVAIFGVEDGLVYGKYFNECIVVERRKKDGIKWSSCPCWGSQYCSHRLVDGMVECMRSITVNEVLSTLRKKLDALI